MLFLSAKFFMLLWARNLADALEKSEGDMMREMLCQVVKCVEKKITKIPSILLAEFRKTTYFCTQVLIPQSLLHNEVADLVCDRIALGRN